MRFDLNSIDPLPVFSGEKDCRMMDGRMVPISIREWDAAMDRAREHLNWKPTGKPDLFINGKGQMAYRPAEPVGVDLASGQDQTAMSSKNGPLLNFLAVLRKEIDSACGIPPAEAIKSNGPSWTTPDGRILEMQEDGWYPHKPGDPMPCGAAVKILRMYRSGPGSDRPEQAGVYFWGKAPHCEMVAWKPV